VQRLKSRVGVAGQAGPLGTGRREGGARHRRAVSRTSPAILLLLPLALAVGGSAPPPGAGGEVTPALAPGGTTPPAAFPAPASETPLAAGAAAGAEPASAPVPPALKVLDPDLFPLPKEIEPNVSFWTEVFQEHTSKQVVLHDEDYPGRVYAVLDFSSVEDSTLSEVAKRRRREEAIRDKMSRVRSALGKLAHGQKLEDEEEARRFAALFPGADRHEFRAAADRLRTQTGLADHFETALERSGRYLPRMERTFSSRGLPTELTRIPFVESMFQEHARSKVAAGGMWQIMPSSGRRLLAIGVDVDERFDPFLAAEAAATILKENHASLGTWPLAITAYNYGVNGLARAVATLGTRDFGVIVSRHRSRVFGFASRNFYAEFLAAATLHENRGHHFPAVSAAPELTFDELRLSHFVSARELAARAGTDLEALRVLNPALSHEVWSGRLLVPAGYRLRVPPGQGEAFGAAYAALPAELKLGRQAGFEYRVRPGDNLGSIARRYGTTVSALQQANRLGSHTLIRAGQVLRVPPGRGTSSGAGAVAARPQGPTAATRPTTQATAGAQAGVASPGTAGAAAGSLSPAAAAGAVPALPDGSSSSTGSPAPGPAPAGQRVHVVRRGDTLYSIARRYGVTVETLMRANGLSGHRIQPGQRLAIGG
jgi:membrane-bound lytic murein transglycosylase D